MFRVSCAWLDDGFRKKFRELAPTVAARGFQFLLHNLPPRQQASSQSFTCRDRVNCDNVLPKRGTRCAIGV